jgi:predicted unusual protein kinase regulating ubiquinone biosynthesis (AarF/ABC1/UbiB family)
MRLVASFTKYSLKKTSLSQHSGSQRPNSYALKARYRRIVRFAALALAQSWWFEIALPQLGLGKLAARSRIRRFQKLARKFHKLAADLGGLMIKAGQFLSSRLDILPPEITKELEGLQDEVEAESFADILAQVENELGMPVEIAFDYFEQQPLAAASLGQAHRAKLKARLSAELGFEDVVVKVLRPGIEDIVAVDLAALRKIGKWLSLVKLVSRRADAPALVEEFALTSFEEIDYLHEAQNLERFKSNFAQDQRVSAPVIVWERSSRRVLTLSDVTAIKITDFDALDTAGIDPKAVAAELARITFEQFFVHGFFHADPHPGNIFVTPNTTDTGIDFSLTFIDFGMMGEISDNQRAKLQTFIFAVVARDARAWIAATEDLGILLPTVDTVQLERAIAELFKRFGGVGVAELTKTDPKEIREFAKKFSELVLALPFQLPENYLLLIRSISVISGVTSALNREFNMWDAVDPFARSLLQGGANSSLQKLGRDAVGIASTLLRLPGRLESLASRIERGELTSRNPELESRVSRVDGSLRRVTTAAIFATLLITGAALRLSGDELGTWLMVGSAVPLLHAIGLFRLR